jgi:dimethylargininase
MMLLSTTRSCLYRCRATIHAQSPIRDYTIALARQVSPLITNAIVMNGESESDTKQEPISYSIAHEQHQVYLSTLRTILPTLALRPLDNHPDCVFVEDTMVAVGDTVVMTRPGHASREGEVPSLREIVLQLGLKVVDMGLGGSSTDTSDVTATLDGGDVLYTGRHMYVGLSSRTNAAGVQFLQEAFPHIRVIDVPLPRGDALHLKSVITHLDEETLLAPASDLGTQVLSNMLDSGGYETIRLPNVLACNVVLVNGNVLAQDVDCEESKDLLRAACQERNLKIHWVNTSELAKVDGALTCCSVLLDC